MDFYQTPAGKQFYGQTIPQIAAALKTISAALSSPAPCIRLEQTAPENFLAELYRGNFDPSGSPASKQSAQYTDEIRARQKAIAAKLPPELWEEVDHIFTLLAMRNVADQETAFAVGFQTATAMFAAGLGGNSR